MSNPQEITRDEWQPFFDAFSGLHRGSPVTLEVVGDTGNDEVAADAPLEEIAADGADRIAIVLRAAGTADELSHVVERPEHVWLMQDDAETKAAIEIESARGTTRLRFEAGELPR